MRNCLKNVNLDPLEKLALSVFYLVVVKDVGLDLILLEADFW